MVGPPFKEPQNEERRLISSLIRKQVHLEQREEQRERLGLSTEGEGSEIAEK